MPQCADPLRSASSCIVLNKSSPPRMKSFLTIIGMLALLGGLLVAVVSSSAVHEIEAGIAWLIACTSLGLAKVIELQEANGKILAEIKAAQGVSALVNQSAATTSNKSIEMPPVPGTEIYFVAVEGKAAGPHSMESVQGLLSRGKITPETLIYKQGAEKWQPLSEVFDVNAV